MTVCDLSLLMLCNKLRFETREFSKRVGSIRGRISNFVYSYTLCKRIQTVYKGTEKCTSNFCYFNG